MFFRPESARNFDVLVEVLRQGGATAFIGAGLSAPDQPTWRELHELVQQRARIRPRRLFNPSSAPLDFDDFRRELGDKRFLSLIQDQFRRPPGSASLDLYRIVDETAGVIRLVTTNFDEHLAAVADRRGDTPEAYPDFTGKDARYIYLHGRAITATDPSQLVLGEKQYAEAYGGFRGMPGRATRVLFWLLFAPVFFVGSSLSDFDLQVLLRAFARARDDSKDPELFAILAARPQMAKVQTLESVVEVETQRLRVLGVKPIWYTSDDQYSQLRSVLLELQRRAEPARAAPRFLERAEEVERFAALQSPTVRDRNELLRLIRLWPELARHFFQHATSPVWYDLLRESGVLDAVEEPYEDGRGRLRAVPWAAEPYVQRIATDRPDAVLELARRRRATDNWLFHMAIADLAGKLPDEYLEELLPILYEWLGKRPKDVVAYRLVEMLDVLRVRGSAALALDVLGNLLEPTDEAGSGTKDAIALRVEPHQSGELLAAVRWLADQQPHVTYYLVKERLDRALRLLSPARAVHSAWWRPAIEDHSQNMGGAAPLHTLVAATRDALRAWAARDPAAAAQEIDRLLDTDPGLPQRLGLDAAAERPEVIKHLRSSLITRDRFFNPETFHELARLVRQRFTALPAAEQELVHALLREGPPREETAASEDEWQRQSDLWRQYWLAVLPPEHQTEEERSWYAALAPQWEDGDEPFFPYYSTVRWVPPDRASEALADAYATGGVPGVLEALRASRDPGRALQSLVQADPVGLLPLSSLLTPGDAHLVGPYLRGYERALTEERAALGIAWQPLVDFAERVTGWDLPSEGDTAIARLLSRGMADARHGIPDDLLDRAVAIAVQILDRSFTALTMGLDEQAGSYVVHQLNSAPGNAADAILLYLWRRRRALTDGWGFPRDVRQWLDRALEDGWGGVELRHALGQRFHVLEWCEPGWVTSHAAQLVPQGAAPEAWQARRAFFNGYLLSNVFAEPVMQQLRPLYWEAVPDTAAASPQFIDGRERALLDRFVQQVAVGWLWDVDGFGFDGLLGAVLQRARDGVRGELVRYLAAEYRKADGEGRDLLRRKLDEYWGHRTQALKDLPAGQGSRELTELAEWPDVLDVPLMAVEDRLRLSVDHLDTGIALGEVADLLGRRAAAEPGPTARLLERLVDRWTASNDPELYWSGRGLESALRAVYEHGGEDERAAVVRMVDRVREAGRDDYRSVLG